MQQKKKERKKLLRYWLKGFITLLAIGYYNIGFITFKIAKMITLLVVIMFWVVTRWKKHVIS